MNSRPSRFSVRPNIVILGTAHKYSRRQGIRIPLILAVCSLCFDAAASYGRWSTTPAFRFGLAVGLFATLAFVGTLLSLTISIGLRASRSLLPFIGGAGAGLPPLLVAVLVLDNSGRDLTSLALGWILTVLAGYLCGKGVARWQWRALLLPLAFWIAAVGAASCLVMTDTRQRRESARESGRRWNEEEARLRSIWNASFGSLELTRDNLPTAIGPLALPEARLLEWRHIHVAGSGIPGWFLKVEIETTTASREALLQRLPHGARAKFTYHSAGSGSLAERLPRHIPIEAVPVSDGRYLSGQLLESSRTLILELESSLPRPKQTLSPPVYPSLPPRTDPADSTLTLQLLHELANPR